MKIKSKAMNKFLLVVLFFYCSNTVAQENSPWIVTAKNIDPNHYYGVTLANGMVGLVSSPEPLKVKDVVLNGVYDYYQRGRVSNILKGFNHINLNLDVDNRRVGPKDIKGYTQVLDMQNAILHS